MKDINWRKIFGISWRLLSVIVVACASSLVLIHSIFNGNEKINNLLFSQKADVSLFAPLIVEWAFGFFEGGFFIFLSLVKDLWGKEKEMQELKKRIASLQECYSESGEEYVPSPQFRALVNEISDKKLGNDAENTGNLAPEEISPLQDILRAIARETQEHQSPPEPKDSRPESQLSEDSGPESQETKDSEHDKE